jgi:selenocysteine lyase/cysteine desulfurase
VNLGDRRELFDIPEGITYLNCAYMSPQLRAVREVGEEAVRRKSRPWEILPKDFFEDSETARALFAELIGGEADGVAIIPSVSYGMAVAAANLPVEAGQKIVILEEQFPSNVYVWRELAKRTRAELLAVPRPADHDWTGAMLECVDRGTAVVAVPNCHWTDGTLVNLVRVGERARDVGAALVVDGIQSLGAHPFDVKEIRPDFLIASSYKWLLGPYGLGFMYVGESYRDGEPIEHNWINRRGSEDFSRLVEYEDAFQAGARRFDVGERSSFVLLPMANEALRRILDWSVANVAETLSGLTDRIEDEARKVGLEAMPAKKRVGHMIGIKLGPEAPEDLAARLAKENVFVSVRGRALRVSPHLYNTERDVVRLFEALGTLLPAGAD